MQYIWQHRLYPAQLATVDGRRVRVIDPGLHNTNAGPDFFNAKVEIGGEMWVGNVEMHVRASDWLRHGHNTDLAYDSVILHVVQKDDMAVTRSNGERIAQMVLQCSPHFYESYTRLVTGAESSLPCAAAIKEIPGITITEWIESLAFERLNDKVARIFALFDTFSGSWQDICYVTFARSLGFGINNDAFEMLARRTPLRLMHKHSDSIFQLEALLFGQAGFFNIPMPGASDDYYSRLAREYTFLANKFELRPMDGSMWKAFRVRPQNFPYRRIALLARMVDGGFSLMDKLLQAPDARALRSLLSAEMTGYWATHYTFGGAPAEIPTRVLSNASIDILLINTVAPLYYAYGSKCGDFDIADRAVSLLESLRPERNSIVAQFTAAGIPCPDALTSQALIQLRRHYCEARKCLYCKIGHRLLTKATQI